MFKFIARLFKRFTTKPQGHQHDWHRLDFKFEELMQHELIMSTGNWTRSLDETLHRLQRSNGYSNRVLETKVCLTCGEVVDRIADYKAELIASNFVDRIKRQFEAEDAERARRATLASELFAKAKANPQIQ